MTNDIYTYIFDNFNIKVTDYTFKRDYIKEPLELINSRLREEPYKEDLEYFHQVLNCELLETCKCLNVSKTTLIRWLKKYNIKKITKTKNGEIIKRGKTPNREQFYRYVVMDRLTQNELLEKYNLKSYSCLKYWKRIFNIPRVISKKVKLNEYNRIINEYNIDQNYIHYSLKNPIILGYAHWESDIRYLYIEKNLSMKDLCLFLGLGRKYIEKQNRIYNIQKDKSLIDKNIEKTNMKIFGNRSYFGSKNYYKDVHNIVQKIDKTLKINGSYSKSKEEIEIYNMLIRKFSNVEIQYKSKLYPYKCDYYIVDLDLYIEYQGTWHHGTEPFDINNPNHQKIVKLWEDRSKETNFKGDKKKQYNVAIYNWTIRDPLKRQIAKDNNLNYLEFFNKTQFVEWFDKQ